MLQAVLELIDRYFNISNKRILAVKSVPFESGVFAEIFAEFTAS